MANPLFQQLGGAAMNSMSPQFGQLVGKYKQFRQTFQGDPRQKVERLLQSGQLTQEQLNIAQSMAQQFSSLWQERPLTQREFEGQK